MDKLSLGFEVLRELNNAGFDAYIVGGAVRDYLLNKPIDDIDITTNANVNDVCSIFKEYDLDASEFAGVTIYYKGFEFEVTSFRKDIEYKDHRHPLVLKASNLKEDLVRRDFTMNALALDVNKNIIDIFEGIKAIESKKITCIGPADVRFDEDALRVLRALYFSSKLDFILDKEIIDSIVKFDYVSYLPKEYIKNMFEKIISFDSKMGLKYLVLYKVLRGFPFYQVLAEECYRYNANKDEVFALFYALHGFLPENERITKDEYKKAKLIGDLIRNNFNSISLYNSKGLYLKEAKIIFNKICGILFDVEKKYCELPIHSTKDIKFDFSKIKNNILQKEIIYAILNKEIDNNEEEIINYIKMRS